MLRSLRWLSPYYFCVSWSCHVLCGYSDVDGKLHVTLHDFWVLNTRTHESKYLYQRSYGTGEVGALEEIMWGTSEDLSSCSGEGPFLVRRVASERRTTRGRDTGVRSLPGWAWVHIWYSCSVSHVSACGARRRLGRPWRGVGSETWHRVAACEPPVWMHCIWVFIRGQGRGGAPQFSGPSPFNTSLT